MSANSNQNTPTVSPGAILSEPQWNAITQAISGLNAQQLTWVSGYMAGLAASGQALPQAPAAGAVAAVGDAPTLTILFGSQTGNSKGVAQSLQAKMEAAGYTSKLVSMADFKPRQIKNETHLAIVASTHGEGEPPDDAIELHEFLGSKKAPKVEKLKYAVLSLGDSSYEFFCQTGKDFDERLAKLGGKAVLSRVDCDVDYEAEAQAWCEKLIDTLKEDFTTQGSAAVAMQTGAAVSTGTAVQAYTKKAPFNATLLTSQKITGRDSVKDIRHIEISLEDSGIAYQVGDALGVWFKNDASLADDIITLIQASADQSVDVGGQQMTFKEALVQKLELTLSYPGFVKAYQEASQCEALATLMEDKAAFREYLSDRQIVDIVREHPHPVPAQRFVEACRPLTPRLYSIASSQAEVEDEVHLTIAHVEYDAFGKRHQGGASGYLCERLEEGGEVEVFVEPNDNFRLPENTDTPVIMIGPGTGIAPFRAFMQERDAQGAEGKNWLFFGNPNFTQDFLYQVEWQSYVKSGLLSKISLAFSRDQKEKIYVQHRLLEEGKAVFEWLEEGAHLYVCGDANHMAKDVEAALLEIIKTHGGKDDQEAKAYLVGLRKAKRYQKDVY
ncbi:assimilatory sulfite reductase (NADPH) flavoprotein subunit [Alteromonas gilva]|uniref:Sulfite reductase [NADPH] flavoprotein alpha-component n=1 Tax=Alteromonas gilva TaxID=2987522 RepID=A0ABT5L5I9_9ALTE|nr:assimilatory sulfite reductase (NADPH) flavoprotein subunit [Alteromonas gilva]MDC8832320.1 assimilatory sulfite reductase (NADPH) flavoprotein subunit [Alteromonas gilva]